jgi:hypothetical protein
MTTVYPNTLCCALLLATALLAACVGTTAIQEDHPAIATASATDQTMVYFMRPDPGFRGVMDRPLTISVNGQELLSLAKGQYALLPLKSGGVEMKLDSYTVAGRNNALTAVSNTAAVTLPAGSTLYLIFVLVPREPLDLWAGSGSVFAPRSVSREIALEIARGLSPVGMATEEPIK